MTKTTRALVKMTDTVSLEDRFNQFFDLWAKPKLGDDVSIILRYKFLFNMIINWIS